MKTNDSPDLGRFIPPMLATLVGEPFNSEDFWFEPKWDGMRVMVVVSGSGSKLYSRNGIDITEHFPEFAPALVRLLRDNAQGQTVLDGEIVTLDDDGLPAFELLQRRIGVANVGSAKRLAADHPCTLMLFDCLASNGSDTTGMPLSERRQILEQIYEQRLTKDPRMFLSEVTTGHGRALFEAAESIGMEGIVAKRIASRYLPGIRSKDWIKVKVVNEDDYIVIGWTEGQGARSGGLGALILGAYDRSSIRHVGMVGTGFDEATMTSIRSELEALGVDEPDTNIDVQTISELTDSPSTRWVMPKMVVTVSYSKITLNNRLRHPSFKTVRRDKEAEDCRLDWP